VTAGTHNSFTFELDDSGPLAPGVPASVHGLVASLGVLAKKIVSNWSKTQSLDVDAQLKAGVRYFDVRVGARHASNLMFVVHGFYGAPVDDCLDSLRTFLDEHSREIVLLDFNHFYDMDSDAHERLIKALTDRFIGLSLQLNMDICETIKMLLTNF